MRPGPSTPAAPRNEIFGSPTALSVAWQVLGSSATLGSAMWVSWRMGLPAQGEFGFAKSWFDAGAAMAALGLPQGLLHLQYRLKVPTSALLQWLARTLLGLAVAAVIAAGAMLILQNRIVAAVLVSLPFAVGHLLARSMLLVQRGVVVFGIITALPSVLVLAGVVAYGMLGHATDFDVLLLVAAALSGSVSVGMAWHSAGRPRPDPWSRQELWQISLQSWLQGALGALLVAGLLSTVKWAGRGGSELGAASLGLHLYQLFAVAAGYMAPLLFDRLAKQDRPALGNWPPLAVRAAVVMLLLALAGIAVSVVEPAWSAWLLPMSLMLPAGVAAIAARIGGTVLLARSAYTELSFQAAWRLALAMALTAIALQWLAAAAAVALAMLVVELVTWWRAAALGRVAAA